MEDSVQDSDGSLCEFTSHIPFVSGCAADVRIILVSVVSTLLAFERGSLLLLTLETLCVVLDTTSADVLELVISGVLPDVNIM